MFECKNGQKLEDILLKEFENTQNIDLAKIICEECKQYNKSKTHENKFFKCMNCKKNICPLCKSTHNKEHKILNYEDINYKCDLHFENYNSYCEDCKKNICLLCSTEHNSHKTIKLGSMIPNRDELKTKITKLKEDLDKFNEDINHCMTIITNILNQTKESIEKYYVIINDIINNCDFQNINYELLYNLNEAINSDLIKDLDIINNEKLIKNKFNYIFDIYNKINYNEITMIYKIGKRESIQIFDEKFVNNNKSICKIIYDGKEYDLNENFELKNLNKSDIDKKTIEIKLKGINNITDMSYIFNECGYL